MSYTSGKYARLARNVLNEREDAGAKNTNLSYDPKGKMFYFHQIQKYMKLAIKMNSWTKTSVSL